MERLFSPCTRLHEILENQGRLGQFRRYHPELLQELNLDVSTEELLSAECAFTYADIYATLGNEDTVAWLTPHAAVAREHESVVNALDVLTGFYRFYFIADGIEIVAAARSPEHLLEICDIVVRLLAVSVVHSVHVHSNGNDDIFINAPSLAYLMEQCQSLKSLTLKSLEMDENHCRVLGAYSRPDLEIILNYCRLTSAGASALAEVLGRNQGPTMLDWCYIDNYVLADGLRGNSRLKSLKPCFSSNLEVRDREVLAIAGALRENKGLVYLHLSFYGFRVTDETWCAICDSLHAHPTLEVLDLVTYDISGVIDSRIQALLDMVKVNMSIHTIQLAYRYSQQELFRGSVIPYLETNRFRPRLLAIQRTRPIPYRAKVLGSALLSARTDVNSFWILLSGNAEVAFPSTTVTIAVAGNLPDTSTTAAATSTANVAAIALTSVTDSLLIAAAETAIISAATPSTGSDALAFAPTVAAAAAAAAGNVTAASPSTGQKRKARL
jgi:hypothetical protein